MRTVLRYLLIGMACAQLASQSLSAQPVDSALGTTVPTADVQMAHVVLNAAGSLVGQALDRQWQPLGAVAVALYQEGRQIAATHTDPGGRYEFANLRGGDYVVAGAGGFTNVRLWTAEAAPPDARPMATLFAAPLDVPPESAIATDEGVRQASGYTETKPFEIPTSPPAVPTTTPFVEPAGGEPPITKLADWLQEQQQEATPQMDIDTAPSSTNNFDPAVVAQGRAAFSSGCTTCHDAARSLERRKTYSAWLATTRRMAAKPDADIPVGDIVPIATYLAAEVGATADTGGAEQPWSFNATIATLWRDSSGDIGIANPGFFPDVWIGADYQTDSPLSASIMVCTSCHSDFNLSRGFTFELVEATAKLDLVHLATGKCCKHPHCGPEVSAYAKAGRFVVPFGAFAGMSHPGVYRTVTNPLIFDMGRRFEDFLYLPVLPQPYSDEGLEFNMSVPVGADSRLTADFYVVNGLQGDLSMSFADSRAYDDNNRVPAVGGRVTLGNRTLRVGTSFMSGEMQDDGAAVMTYSLVGADLTYRYEDLFRFYFEYALRQSGQAIGAPFGIFYGIVTEWETLLNEEHGISLVLRYDTLNQRDYLNFADTNINRFTVGFNFQCSVGGEFMINHETWLISNNENQGLLGLKWIGSF